LNRPFSPGPADKQRALALLVAAASLLIAVLYVPVIRPWRQTETRLAVLKARIAETLQAQSRAPAIEAALRTLRENASARGDYLPESTVALGNAALAMRIQSAVDGSVSDTDTCVLGDRLPIRSDTPSQCTEARLKVKLQCGSGALEKVLRNLETQTPRLRIDRITLALGAAPTGFGQRPDTNTPIDANFEVSGCLLNAPLVDETRITTP